MSWSYRLRGAEQRRHRKRDDYRLRRKEKGEVSPNSRLAQNESASVFRGAFI